MTEYLPKGLKIPHMGWNSLHITNPDSRLFANTKEGDFVYFVHSFFAKDCEASLAASTEYGIPITAAVEQGNVFGCQFHPEKSGNVGLEILRGFAEKASKLQREEVDFSQLCLGLKCGGSDGYSGLTANPLVGKISDKIVGLGGSAILTEVPEMFGAEQLLMNKCKNEEVFEKYKKMIEDFKAYYTKQGFPVYENPSPGNKKGGITTLEEKSLGCVEKAGTSKIVSVLDYGEMVKEGGVSALNAPGNDLIAATALAASGAQLVLFTTGRGTPFSTFVPTLKIASNDKISAFKNNWVDFNAYSMDEDGLFDLIVKTVNGEYVCKSEDIREIAFYKTGVTL
jgi:altronate hydrolase